MSPAVAFHTGVDKLEHACRLLRKAYRQGAKVIVTADGPLLARLDQALWTFEPIEFVPHARIRRGEPVIARRGACTPIWLVEPGGERPHRDVLVNLGADMVEGWDQFGRVIEVVSADPDDVAAGRRRWRAYAQQGAHVEHVVKREGA